MIEAAVWTTAPFLGYAALVGSAALAGLFMVPVFSVVRQSLAVLVPEEEQRTAFALDSVCTELTFMLALALAVLVATTWSMTAALVAVGVATVGAGTLLMWLDPPTRSAQVLERSSPAGALGRSAAAGSAPLVPTVPGVPTVPAARMLTPALVVVLLASSAASLVPNGTDLNIIAALVERDHASAAGWMIALWAGGRFGDRRRRLRSRTTLGAPAGARARTGTAHGPGRVRGNAAAPRGRGGAGGRAVRAGAVSDHRAALVRIVPEDRRGEVMGWNGSAMTVGAALGAPLCGALIDRAGAGAEFLAAGAVGGVVAGSGLVVLRTGRVRARRGSPAPTEQPTADRRRGVS